MATILEALLGKDGRLRLPDFDFDLDLRNPFADACTGREREEGGGDEGPLLPAAFEALMARVEANDGELGSVAWHDEAQTVDTRGCARLGVAMGVAPNTHVQVVDLSRNRISLRTRGDFDRFATLTQAVVAHPALVSLDLSLNELGLEAACLLAAVLRDSPTLLELDLHGNHLGASGAAELGKGLAAPTCQLQVLNLAENELGNRGAGKVAVALVMNSSLVHLNLDLNWIGVPGVESLGSALAKNASLRWLSLCNNDVTDSLRNDEVNPDGLQLLLGPAAGRSLTTLRMSDASLQDAGAVVVAQCLEQHPSLTEVDLSACAIGTEGGAHLLDAVAVNRNITRLHLHHNDITWSALPVPDELAGRVRMYE